MFPRLAAFALAACFVQSIAADAHPAVIYVFPPPPSATANFPSSHVDALKSAIKSVVSKLGACQGASASLIDRTVALPAEFGTEAADAFITTNDGSATPRVVLTIERGTTRELVGVKDFDASEAANVDYCAILGSSLVMGSAQANAQPLRSVRFFDIIPDSDADRQYVDLLLFRMREFGYDGQLLPTNFDNSFAELSTLCVTNKRAFRYHVLQTSDEQKSQGSTSTTTAVGGTVLSCNSSETVDTVYAAPRTETHYVSFGTLLSSVVGLAVALKPKISTAQLTSALPLFATFINRPDTLPEKQRDAVSEAFRVMMCDYTKPNSRYHASAVPAPAPSLTYEKGHACGSDRTNRSATGIRI